MAVSGLDGFVHEHHRAIEDANVAHGVTGDAHVEGGLRVAHQLADFDYLYSTKQPSGQLELPKFHADQLCVSLLTMKWLVVAGLDYLKLKLKTPKP